MDDVPPKNLFEPHARSNLVTVPCCFKCNNSASMDDQYFLVFIGFREDAKQEPEHHKLWQKALRTLKRKEASKFRQRVTSGIKFVQPVTPMGIILPRALSVHIDGSRLPDTHRVIAYDELALGHAPIDRSNDVFHIRALISTLLQNTPRKTIGKVFGYHWVPKPAEPATTMWLLDFFDGIPFFCMTQPTGNNLLR
jgi:hypothetical protein